jgi:hypothetical protein
VSQGEARVSRAANSHMKSHLAHTHSHVRIGEILQLDLGPGLRGQLG